MDLGDRIIYMVLGAIVGFVAGYIVRSLRDIRKELDEVHSHIPPRDEAGELRFPELRNVLLLFVVLATAWAAFYSQKASNDIEAEQDENIQRVGCIQTYLDRTITALNERTTFTVEQAKANAALQRAQSRFLEILLSNPPKSEEIQTLSLNNYADKLSEFIALSEQSVGKIEQNPYPTPEELDACLSDRYNQ